MEYSKKYFKMKCMSEKIWSDYLELFETDMEKYAAEIHQAANVMQYLGLKRVSAALEVLITKSFLDVAEKNRGIL